MTAALNLTQSGHRCNCSICRRAGGTRLRARPLARSALAGESELTKYLFDTRKNEHWFCRHCGVRAFGIGTDTPLGCLDEVGDEELSRLAITYLDGREDRWQHVPAFFAHL